MFTDLRRISSLAALLWLAVSALSAQQDRLTGPIDKSRAAVLRGHVHVKARPQDDQGPLAGSSPVAGITIHLKKSPGQQRALNQLLADQQNSASPLYHKWLTPEQYADQFGVSRNDLDQIGAWLQSEGLSVQNVARSRARVTLSGSAAQIRNAFRAELHRYQVDGQTHYANATEPSIPAALQELITSISGLDDFGLEGSPLQAFPEGTQPNGSHNLAPDDLATIYNISPLYKAGVDGTGQKIAIVGQTSLNLADIRTFRSRFNLPANDPQIILVPNHPDPGLSVGNLAEADLDVEWSGAVARNATILYVYSTSAYTALAHVVDQNLAPVVSASFSAGCEARNLAALQAFQDLAQQANAQGITWINSAGDAGAAACETNNASIAQNGKAVRFPGSVPEITSVGGTQLNEINGNYWNGTNDANGASAISYIPEIPWNSAPLRGSVLAGGGGTSTYFPRPSWQTGPGVPNNGFRNVPDVSLAASPDHDGYFVATNGGSGNYGGTSVSAPVFAGMVALLNQYLVSTGAETQAGLGNLNPTLYRLAENKPGIFHDITTGNINVPCAGGSPDCTGSTFGFTAGPGYDLATGLGSPDAFNLLHQWSSQPVNDSLVVVSISPNPVYQKAPDSQGLQWSYTITLNEEAGVGTTLTDFSIDGVSNTSQIASFFGSATIPPKGQISASLGAKTLTVPRTRVFMFSGVDASGRQWSQSVPVVFNGPAAVPTVVGVSNAASGQQTFAPGMLMSVYGTLLGNRIQGAAAIPLITYMGGFSATVNGVAAPLYFVSPGQVNVQIPYETGVGTARLVVNTGLQTGSFTFQVSAAAPGVFMDASGATVPFPKGSRGQTLTLFITGEGQVSPTLATGATPSPSTPFNRLPAPVLKTTMTIGGVDAPIQFIGIPNGLVGVTQVNFLVPQNAPLGVQPVVVTVGSTASPAAKFTVQ